MNWWEQLKTALNLFFGKLASFFDVELFELGQKPITLENILLLILSLALLFYLTNVLQKMILNRILRRAKVDRGVRQSIGTIFRYTLIVIGLTIIIQTAGIDLTALGFIAGALGVGIGFGLQGITNNFISGLIILFERPIKVGDRIEVGTISGDVTKIAARATTVQTNDNISIIIPNSDFINKEVINWSHNDRRIRYNIPVSVAYKENPRYVRRLLIEVVKENHGVLKHPAPDVLFTEYGESSLDFNVRVWTIEYTDRPMVLKSQLYYAIFKKFQDHHIEIPFPQRDVHIKYSDTQKVSRKEQEEESAE